MKRAVATMRITPGVFDGSLQFAHLRNPDGAPYLSLVRVVHDIMAAFRLAEFECRSRLCQRHASRTALPVPRRWRPACDDTVQIVAEFMSPTGPSLLEGAADTYIKLANVGVPVDSVIRFVVLFGARQKLNTVIDGLVAAGVFAVRPWVRPDDVAAALAAHGMTFFGPACVHFLADSTLSTNSAFALARLQHADPINAYDAHLMKDLVAVNDRAHAAATVARACEVVKRPLFPRDGACELFGHYLPQDMQCDPRMVLSVAAALKAYCAHAGHVLERSALAQVVCDAVNETTTYVGIF